MSRPSDEDMVGVVKEWKEWPIDCIGFTRRNIRLYASEGCTDSFGERLFSDEPDPRDDTDAALELAWHFEMQLLPIYSISKGPGWIVNNGAGRQWVPPSGSAFRYAICNLAVEVKNANS